MSTIRTFLAASAAALLSAGAAAAQTTTPAPAQTPDAAAPAATPATPAAPATSAATPAAPAASATPPAATGEFKPVVAQGDLVDTLKLSGQFKTFVQGLDATNLTGLLKTNKNLTVFAPTDMAFAAMPADKLAALKSDKTAMQKFLLQHIVNAPIESSKIKGAKGPIPSAAGDQILLDGSDEGGQLKVDGANIVQADIHTGSGLLHVVDHVLVSGVGGPAAPTTATSSTESAPAAEAAGAEAANSTVAGTNTTPKP